MAYAGIRALSAVRQSDALLHAKGMVLKAKKEIMMGTQQVYEDVRAKAETLSPEELSRLIGELSKFLQEKYGTWSILKDVEDVRNYLEWIRFRDSHQKNGQPKSPEEFLAELGAEE